MDCPGSEHVAACAEGRLDPAAESLFLEHCADCEECRRELALAALARAGSVPSPAAGVAPGVRRAVLRAVDRERGLRASAARRLRPEPRTGFAAAAVVLVALGVAAVYVQLRPGIPSPAPSVARRAEPRPIPPEPVPEPEPAPPAPPMERPPAPEPVAVPEPAPPDLPEEPIPAPVPDPGFAPVPPPPPGPGETRPQEGPAHGMATRVLSPVLITDMTGALSIRRKGAREKEKPAVATRLSEGDVLAAEKPSGFRVEGSHPVVLGEGSLVSLAWVAQEQAPYLQLHSGEAVVDSTGPTRWVVSDGRVSATVQRAVARFSVSPAEGRLAVAALAEPLHVLPDGGRAFRVPAGRELRVTRSGAEVHPLEAAELQRKKAFFESTRPRQRTIFYAACDPADARRGHFLVLEGSLFRNEALLSREAPGRVQAAALSPNPRFAWKENLALRFRFMTNATALQVTMRVEEQKYSFQKTLHLERKGVNQWQTAAVPMALSNLGFQRDDGAGTLTVGWDDRIDWIRFSIQNKDVFGDQKPYVLVDDVEVFEREKE